MGPDPAPGVGRIAALVMGWRAGKKECHGSVEAAAKATCRALDSDPDRGWQWCGPYGQTGDQTHVVSFNEAAGTAVLRMHCESAFSGCGTGFNGETGRNITFTFKPCEEFDSARMAPVFAGFELAGALLVAGLLIKSRFWK